MNACTETIADLEEQSRGADVVIFRSGLTDARQVTDWCAAHGVHGLEIEMGMAAGAQRERFRCLEQWTGWRLLPQIFIKGEFVGGLTEFFAHPFVVARDAGLST